MRKALSMTLVLAVLALLVPSAASAAEMKIGVIDLEYVVLKSKKGQNITKKLKSQVDKARKDLEAKGKDALVKKEALQKSSEMDSADRKRKLAVDYQNAVVEYQELAVKHQQEIADKERKMMEPLYKDLAKVIEDYAQANDFDLVMSRSQFGVVFRKPGLDITEEIIKKLDGGK